MQSTLIESYCKRKRVLHGGIHHASTCNYERDDIVFFTRENITEVTMTLPTLSVVRKTKEATNSTKGGIFWFLYMGFSIL